MKRIIVPLFVAVALAAGLATSVAANPKGARGEEVGKMLYKFNVLAAPHDWSGDDSICQDNGRRVFFDRGGGSLGTIEWQIDPNANGFQLLDCDGTSDGSAIVEGDETVPFLVFIRIHGPATSTLDVVCDDIVEAGLDDLCLIDGGTFSARHDSFTKIMENVVDNAYEEVLWTLDASTNFRNLEVRVYEGDNVFSQN